MILRLSMLPAAVAGLFLAAAPARADVMQIDADGARWIASAATEKASEAAIETEPMPEGPDVPARSLADVQATAEAIPQTYRDKVHELAARFDLSPALIEALVWQESRWRADAVSPVGARGLAQLMPGTARDLGVDPRDPFANLEGGARYLREQLDRFGGDLELALAAYNAGPGRVAAAGGIPRIRETQTYVAAIMGRLSDHSRE